MYRRIAALQLTLVTLLMLLASRLLAVDYGETYFKFKTPARDRLDKISAVISIDRVSADEVHAYANDAELARFEKLGIDYEILPHPGTLIQPRMAATKSLAAAWDSYPTYDAYVAMMYQFQTDYPGLCQIVNAGSTVNGRAILFARISDNVATEENEPEVMYTGTMHGDETTGYILSLRLIDSLLHGYGGDAYTTRLVDSLEIWINPLSNPDGTYYTGNSSVYGARRYNANGVDLNRNFPDPADGDHPDGNSWQAENIVMMDFAEAHSITLSANFHGGAEVINYPWDTWARLHADNDWYYDICLAWAESAQDASATAYLESAQFPNGVTNGYAWYRVAGGRQDYMIYWHGCREITAELSNTKLLPNTQLLNHWTYNRLALMAYLENALYGIKGVVSDASTGLPVAATVRVLNHDVDNTQVYTDPDVGDYHRMLSSGTYDFSFSAAGYETDTVTGITVTDGLSTVVDVALQPLSGEPILTFLEQDVDLIGRGTIVSMAVSLVNSGGGNASGVTATLQISDPYVSVTQNSSTFPTIVGLGGTGTSTVDFTIDVSSSCPLNHSAAMQLDVSASGGYATVIPFTVVIEPVAEDFETGGLTSLPWTSGGNESWGMLLWGVDEGSCSARSGVISNSQSSRLEVAVDVAQAGKLRFDVSVSSERNYDLLTFYLDGNPAGSWSGEVAWTQVSFDLSSGMHTLAWEYAKDSYAAEGLDLAALDRIIFPALTSHLQIVTSSLPDWTVGQPFDVSLQLSGRLGQASWSDKNGDLSASWLSLSPDGHLAGTPTSAGETGFTARVEDATGSPIEQPLTVTINPRPLISTSTLPAAERDVAYSLQLGMTAGTPPIVWTETLGVLTGSGLTLTSGGLLAGTPSVWGSKMLQLRVTDAAGAQDNRTLTLEIIGDCCVGIVGDANQSGDDEPTIGDVSAMIDMLFISGTQVACYAEADVNQSGGLDPIADDVTIGDVSMLIDHLFISGIALPDCL